jgi:hypothetical protein
MRWRQRESKMKSVNMSDFQQAINKVWWAELDNEHRRRIEIG